MCYFYVFVLFEFLLLPRANKDNDDDDYYYYTRVTDRQTDGQTINRGRGI